jgi:hypothetical protein
VIGHALIHTRHPVHPLSESWVAAGFGIGSVCFIVGPFPGFVELVGERADATVFFVGSLFVTSAARPRRSPTTCAGVRDLAKKGGLHEIDRQRVKTGTGY